jgi:hypothetical protein
VKAELMGLSSSYVGVLVIVAAAIVLGFTLAALRPGCGPSEPQFDKAVLYTPELLTQEPAFRLSYSTPDRTRS